MRTALLSLVSSVAAILVFATQGSDTRVAVELVTHSSVIIDRPASDVWPHIVDSSAWKEALPLRHHGGEPGAVGEVFAAFDPMAPDTIEYLVKNVELVPNKRRTIKLTLPGHGALIGYATWTLAGHDGHTLVAYDVYTETLLAPEEGSWLTPEQLAEMTREGYEANKPRFDRELVALKTIVEGPRSR